MKISRRDFLKMTSSLAGTSVLASTMPWFSVFNNPAPAGNAASDRVRIGIVGVGNRGEYLLECLQLLGERMNSKVVAVCDNYQPHYERAIRMTGGKAEAFKDYRAMIDEVPMDAIVIATPLHEHARMTIDALKAGLHVFCEKSMARHFEDVKAMYDTHLEEDKVLVIGHQRLFSPVYLDAMKRIKEDCELGPVVMLRAQWTRNRPWLYYKNTGGRGTALDRRLNWRLYDEFSAGMITELGTHHFQVANWVMDGQPESVMGSGSINFWQDGREVYDNFSLIFKYPGGIHFSYDCTTSNKFNGVEFHVLGSEGTMALERNKVYREDPPPPPAIRTLLHNIESDLFDTIPIGGATWIPERPVSEGGKYITPDYEMDEGLLFLEAFISYVRKGEAPEKLILEGYRGTMWSLLAEKASKTGEQTYIPEEYKL